MTDRVTISINLGLSAKNIDQCLLQLIDFIKDQDNQDDKYYETERNMISARKSSKQKTSQNTRNQGTSYHSSSYKNGNYIDNVRLFAIKSATTYLTQQLACHQGKVGFLFGQGVQLIAFVRETVNWVRVKAFQSLISAIRVSNQNKCNTFRIESNFGNQSVSAYLENVMQLLLVFYQQITIFKDNQYQLPTTMRLEIDSAIVDLAQPSENYPIISEHMPKEMSALTHLFNKVRCAFLLLRNRLPKQDYKSENSLSSCSRLSHVSQIDLLTPSKRLSLNQKIDLIIDLSKSRCNTPNKIGSSQKIMPNMVSPIMLNQNQFLADASHSQLEQQIPKDLASLTKSMIEVYSQWKSKLESQYNPLNVKICLSNILNETLQIIKNLESVNCISRTSIDQSRSKQLMKQKVNRLIQSLTIILKCSPNWFVDSVKEYITVVGGRLLSWLYSWFASLTNQFTQRTSKILQTNKAYWNQTKVNLFLPQMIPLSTLNPLFSVIMTSPLLQLHDTQFVILTNMTNLLSLIIPYYFKQAEDDVALRQFMLMVEKSLTTTQLSAFTNELIELWCRNHLNQQFDSLLIVLITVFQNFKQNNRQQASMQIITNSIIQLPISQIQTNSQSKFLSDEFFNMIRIMASSLSDDPFQLQRYFRFLKAVKTPLPVQLRQSVEPNHHLGSIQRNNQYEGWLQASVASPSIQLDRAVELNVIWQSIETADCPQDVYRDLIRREQHYDILLKKMRNGQSLIARRDSSLNSPMPDTQSQYWSPEQKDNKSVASNLVNHLFIQDEDEQETLLPSTNGSDKNGQIIAHQPTQIMEDIQINMYSSSRIRWKQFNSTEQKQMPVHEVRTLSVMNKYLEEGADQHTSISPPNIGQSSI